MRTLGLCSPNPPPCGDESAEDIRELLNSGERREKQRSDGVLCRPPLLPACITGSGALPKFEQNDDTHGDTQAKPRVVRHPPLDQTSFCCTRRGAGGSMRFEGQRTDC
ncbi:unnamed protein product [Heligmosomoides polygyrus]|uniref:Uncharacterized protein n=1 Tax=Heligmosomoides polygyrus TaxID=6339 RepID=A0A183FM17_HELPZ|nr:unnamed protein product [Heligmosomoides polygyrus]